jgi:asparagine synthase (glutamine-hydrolysing)
MCGIAGIVGSRATERTARAMSHALAHRGPDDSGVQFWPDHGVALGHRRLSIIDLSLNGRNPMSNASGDVWIVYNGEVYNFAELRQELEAQGYRFRTASDTEVVLASYERWGDEHVQRLRGMFAYAIYDRRLGTPTTSGFRLVLVRDRLGVKPLYYYRSNGTFGFASEMKALPHIPAFDASVDRSAIFDYLTYGYVPSPKSAWQRVRKLEPGHRLVYDGESFSATRYWQVPVGSGASDLGPQSLRTLLKNTVAAQLVSDVDVGVFLSGGVDSSSVTASLPEAHLLSTFSIGFDVPQFTETEFARLIASRFGTNHHERVVGVESVKAMLQAIARAFDEPFADGSAVPTAIVSQAAREQVKVVLSGDGGDEVFAGYSWYFAWLRRRRLDFLPELVRRRVIPSIGRLPRLRDHTWFSDVSLAPLHTYARLLELFTPEEKRALVAPEMAAEFAEYDDYWHWRRHWHPDLDPLTRMQVVDLNTYLPDDILTKVDRMSMAVGLEVRPPLLDHLLIEKVMSLPVSRRVPGRRPKGLLKASMRGVLPDEVLDRPKRGFSAPWTVWADGFGPWADKLLAEGTAVRAGILRDGLKVNGARRGAKLWALLLLDQWCRTAG